MSRLLVLGLAPLPVENQPTLSALNRRTWHVARALQEDGHQVLLCCLRVYGAYAEQERLPPVLEHSLRPNLVYRALAEDAFLLGDYLPRWHQEFQPDAVIAITPHTAHRAVSLETRAPMWADLYGYLMGEAQAAALVHDDDRHLAAWHGYRAVLERADIFSTCSLRQRYAVIGELGAVGRLNKATAGYDFVRVMPSAIEPEAYEHTNHVIRGILAEQEDFVVLFAGGYNTWTDVDTLFEGLERAMRRDRRIKFISTGGAIKGHDERTFARFMERVRASTFADRFKFAGWVPTAEVPNYYLESDVGVNVDKFNYETLLGTRYRITDMCKAGLVIVTSLGTELSHEIESAGAGLTFRIGDPAGLADAILRLAADPARRAEMSKRAARYALDHWLYARTLAPLRAWAKQPGHAPDYGAPIAAVIASPAAAFAPRSRMARLAWLIETQGYLRAGRRAAQALLRRAGRLPTALGRWLFRIGVRAALAQRPVAAADISPSRWRSAALIAAEVRHLPGALALLREIAPQAQVVIMAAAGAVLPLLPGGTRLVQIAGGGVRGFAARLGALRAEAPDVIVVVGSGAPGAEALAHLAGDRVLVFDEEGRLSESVLAPLRGLRRGARRMLAGAESAAYAALFGLLMIAFEVADLAGGVVRMVRRGAAHGRQ